MRRLYPTALLAALLVTGPVSAFQASLTPEGYGSLRVGMTLAQLRKTWPAYDSIRVDPEDRTDLVAYGSDDPETCEQYEMGKNAGLVVMVEHGVVTRISAYAPYIMTSEFISVGDAEAKVRKAYGRKLVRRQSPFADGAAHDLYLWTGPNVGIRFGIDDQGEVAFIHAGGESISYEEGCL